MIENQGERYPEAKESEKGNAQKSRDKPSMRWGCAEKGRG